MNERPHPMSYEEAKAARRENPNFSCLELFIYGERQVEGKDYSVDYKRGIVWIGRPKKKKKGHKK